LEGLFVVRISNFNLSYKNTLINLKDRDLSRTAAAVCVVAVVATVVAPVGDWLAREASYRVPAKTAALLPAVDVNLAQKFSYDSKAQTYNYTARNTNTSRVAPPYSASLPTKAAQGIAVTDTKSNLKITLIPQFATDDARQINKANQVIYPIASGGQVIYSSEQNGLKEDIVLTDSPRGGNADYAYKLEMSEGLTAKLEKSGDVGIYSAASKSPQYSLPAPIIKQGTNIAGHTGDKPNKLVTVDNKSASAGVKAWFELLDGALHLKASGLNAASYPLSIDPSIYDNYWTNTSPDNVVDFCGSGATASTSTHAYYLGGTNCSDNLDRGSAMYASYNTDGSTTSWAYTSNFQNVAPPRSRGAAVINGNYIYLIGGTHRQWDNNNGGGFVTDNLTDTIFAHINSDGTLGTWQNTTGYGNLAPNVNPTHAAIRNGYVYVWAQQILYAHINANGTLGDWQTTGSYGTSGFIANGYLFDFDGSFNSAPINGDGSLGTFTYLGYPDLFQNTPVSAALVYDPGNSYLYMINDDREQGDQLFYSKTLAAHIGTNGTMSKLSPLPSPGISNVDGGWIRNGRLYAAGGSAVSYVNLNIEDDGGRDCDSNSIVYCGAYTKGELLDKLTNGDGQHSGTDLTSMLRKYYKDRGVGGPYTSSPYLNYGPYNFSDMEYWVSNAVSGRIYVNGDIYVGDTKVATGAQPCGREQFTGTDYQYDNMWCRQAPNYAPGTDYLEAWIFVDTFYIDQTNYSHYHYGNGTFIGAIMKPCGNPAYAVSTGQSVWTSIPSPSTDITPSPTPTATPHNCCQLTNMQTTVGDNYVNHTTSLSFSWHTGTTAKALAVKVELCTNSNLAASCVPAGGSNMSGASVNNMGGEFSYPWPYDTTTDYIHIHKLINSGGGCCIGENSQPSLFDKLIGAGTAEAAGDTEGDYLTVGQTETLSLDSFVNPSAPGYYFFRITTFSTTDAYYSGIIDCGTVPVYFTDGLTTPPPTPTIEPTPTPTPTPTVEPTPTATPTSAPFVVPPSASYPLVPRVVSLSDSRPGDPNYHVAWGTTHASNVKGVRIQVCTTATAGSTCTDPTGFDLTAATLSATGGQLGASGWSMAVVTNREVLITNASGAAVTAGGNSNVDLSNVTNPTVLGTFYFRVTLYTTVTAAPADVISYGSMATSTAHSLTPTGDVSETLIFRVANQVATDCASQTDVGDPNDNASDLVTLLPQTLSLSVTSVGTAQFCVATNAGGGFMVSYYDAASGGPTKGFYNGAHEFAVANNFTSAVGVEQFGFNLRNNSVPLVGFDPDAAGLVADLTNPQYGTVDQYSYNDTGSNSLLAAKAVPTLSARYTLSYVANISPITSAGTYKARQIFIVTATF
jgi:hypothetical protein